MNQTPTEHTAALYQKFEKQAVFWVAIPTTSEVYTNYNIEEPNFTILVDQKGTITYMGNLVDESFRVQFGNVIDKGTSKSKSSFNLNLSHYSKYIRKFDKKAPFNA